jgi:Arylsulfotransferase (ASST)
VNGGPAQFQTIRRRAGALAALGALAAVVASASSPSPAGATASATPTEVVSPLPGTPDANPDTQISFLGAPASSLRDIAVRGFVTGLHAGRLENYSTHTGGSFLPSTPFAPGERVTVTATIVGRGKPVAIGTSFTVSSPYTLPQPQPSAPVKVTATNVQRFHSRHDLEPPAVTVTTPAADPALGDILLSPDSGAGQSGPMVVAPNGQLVWFHPLTPGTTAFNLQAQSYQGQPVLTWWQGEIIGGHGQGLDVIDNDRYEQIATVHAGNGLHGDLHDFEVTPQGTAWLTAYAPVHWDLRPNGGLEEGLIDDCVVEEVDIRSGLVMFEWHALGHVPIAASYKHAPRNAGTVLDYFHVNSIDPLADGDVLISSRNTWAVYLLSGATGSVEWELGGKSSTFTLGAGVHFAWQHDATLRSDGTVSVFDNEAGPSEAAESRALDISLNLTAHTASLVSQFTHPGPGILAESQGNVQQLSNGDSFVGWGQAGSVSEFSPSGALTFDMHLPPPANSYRAYRVPWSARPATEPALATAAAGPRTELWASWNGATGVAAWRVLAGRSSATLKTVATYRSTGFETTISAPTREPFVRVVALAASGELLRSSAVTAARGRRLTQ